jgi:hypothetical protein
LKVRAIQEAVKIWCKRFITTGDGGSLFVAPNLQQTIQSDFPQERILYRSQQQEII